MIFGLETIFKKYLKDKNIINLIFMNPWMQNQMLNSSVYLIFKYHAQSVMAPTILC